MAWPTSLPFTLHRPIIPVVRIFITYSSNDTKKVVYSLQHTTEDVNVSFGSIFLYIAYTSEKMSVIFECGKVTGDY